MEGIIGLFIAIVFVGIVMYVLWWGLGKLALPEPFNKIGIALLVLLTVVLLLSIFTGHLTIPVLNLKR